MRKFFLALLSLLATGSMGFAQEKVPVEPEPQISREELKETFAALIESGAMKCADDVCAITDKDLISELRAMGLIKSSQFRMSSICIEKGN